MIDLADFAAGGLAVGTLSALVLGGRLLQSTRQRAAQRAEIDRLRSQLDGVFEALTAEVDHLAARRVPAAARQPAHPHVAVPGSLLSRTATSAFGAALDGVLAAVRAELTAQRTRIDAAAQAGMRGATRDIQAALYRLQDALRGLQERYDDPELAQVLFELDHENEQSLRRAQVTAVVCGAWVGLAREESHLVDAVTGGQARLAGYERVRVHNHLQTGTALVSHAVEPVAIIVAELLDNALRHSSADTEVVVHLEHVHHGVCVTVDDAGVGMTRDERARAQRIVAGSEPVLLTDLGDPPRMGLAAVGQLTRQFDLSVDLTSPSPYGGVRAVLRVDSHLLTRVDPAERPPAAGAPRSTRTTPPRAPAAASHGYGTEPGDDHSTVLPGHRGPREDTDHGETSGPREREENAATAATAVTGQHGQHGDTGGLPRRRPRTRGTTPAAPSAPAYRPPRRPEEAAAALGALQSGTAAARAAARAEDAGREPGADTDHSDHEGGAAR